MLETVNYAKLPIILDGVLSMEYFFSIYFFFLTKS